MHKIVMTVSLILVALASAAAPAKPAVVGMD
jgi:hypothetical protein